MNSTSKKCLVWAIGLMAAGVLGMTYGSAAFGALRKDQFDPTEFGYALQSMFLAVIRFATFPVAAALGGAAIVLQVIGVVRRPASPAVKRCLIAGVVLLAVGAIASAFSIEIYSALRGNPQSALQIYVAGLVQGILQLAPGPIATALIGAAIIVQRVRRPEDGPEPSADGPTGESDQSEELGYDPGYSASGIVAFPPDEPS